MNSSKHAALLSDEVQERYDRHVEEERVLAISDPRCPICGGLGFAVASLHTDCQNTIARLERTPEERMRRKWDTLKFKLRPLVIAIHGDKCKCGTFADTIDHTIPISKGGTNAIENLRPMCGDCNRMKKNRL